MLVWAIAFEADVTACCTTLYAFFHFTVTNARDEWS